MNADQLHNLKNWLLTIAGAGTGAAGFTLASADLALGVMLKILSCISVALLILINWNKGMEVLGKAFKTKRKRGDAEARQHFRK